MDIGQRIKQLRESQGMTLEELGQKVGVGKSTIRKWETGMIANMRRDKIKKVADALGVSPDYIMGWTDVYVGDPPIFIEAMLGNNLSGDREEALTRDLQAKNLYDLYQKADPKIQAAVDALLKDDKQS